MIGIDLGGTKIEVVALDESGAEIFRERRLTPRHDYAAGIKVMTELAALAEARLARRHGIGVAIPGCVSRATGLIKNANSTWLNGKPLAADLAAATGREVALINDANCFVLSEATDGAGAGADVVFGVIAGTGVGGGIAVHGKVLEGGHLLAGEWGHNPLPGMTPEEWSEAQPCYCGGQGCIEQWLSGPGLAADFKRKTGLDWNAEKIAASAEADARAAMARWMERMGRALASVVNILDPDMIVLGGGLSNIEALYRDLPALVERHGFCPESPTRISRNIHGDSSGVRGAAWLWPV
ncbi:MAG TPA: ROK family protein [Rhizomicrobium sp.]|nr:ROK family protein [Rhizomicrobium sp.]